MAENMELVATNETVVIFERVDGILFTVNETSKMDKVGREEVESTSNYRRLCSSTRPKGSSL